MSETAIFGVTTIMSFIVFGIVTNLYILPLIRSSSPENALIALIVPHAFRFEGLSFLVPGVVSPSLEQAFAIPAAYGDFCASILGIIAIVALSARVALGDPAGAGCSISGASPISISQFIKA